MRISHIALWTKDIEQSKAFYCTWFGATASLPYLNEKTGFQSYFLEFENTACKLELMSLPEIQEMDPKKVFGMAHFAISAGNTTNVNILTLSLKESGFEILSEPRNTGDGQYESLIADPDGNLVEITI